MGCIGLCSWIILRTKADMVDGSSFGEQDKDSIIADNMKERKVT